MGERLSGNEFAYSLGCVCIRERSVNKEISTRSK